MNLSQSLRLSGLLVYLCFSLSSCGTTGSNVPNQNDDRMKKIIWGEIKDKPIFLYTLTNRNGLKAKITNYGAILTEFHAAPFGDRSNLLNYFIKSRLKNLTETIGEF